MKELRRAPELGKAINEGWALYKENFVLCFVAGLLMVLISAASCGICGAAMGVGYYLVILRLMRKDPSKPQIGDVFKGFSFFGTALLTAIVLCVGSLVANVILNVVPLIGQLASLLLSLAVMPAISALAILLIADQGVAFGDAIARPLKLLKDGRFWSFVLVVFVASIISMLGLIACGIGMFLTLPLFATIVASAYEQMFADGPIALDAPPAA